MRLVKRHGTPLLLISIGIGIGLFVSAQWVPNVSAVGRQDYESLEAFSNILSIVKKNYVEDVETKNLVNGAINGMLNSLDPHSAYLDARSVQRPAKRYPGTIRRLGHRDLSQRRHSNRRLPHRRYPGVQSRYQAGRSDLQNRRRVHQRHVAGRRGEKNARVEGHQDQFDDPARRRRRSYRRLPGA